MNDETRAIVLELKRLREEQRLTYQDIVSQCEAHGEAVSLSTVKRVFGRNGENGDYRYDTTLRPLERVLRGPEPTGDPEPTEDESDLRAALCAGKDQLIKEQRVTLEWYKATLKAARRSERVMIVVLLVLAVALYGMIDYFVFPTSLLFRPGL